MKKKLILVVCIIFSVFLLLVATVFVGLGIALYNGYSFTEGRVLVADNGSYMIIDENGSPIVISNQSKNEDIFADLTNGDEILIVHDGIQESYPAGTGVYFCIKLADGKYEDLSEQTLLSLMEMGWISTPPATQDNYKFTATSLRSYSTPEGIMFPQIRIIKSIDDLNNYIDGFNGEFAEQCKKYDKKYFEEKSLIVVILEEGSGSISHTVKNLSFSDDDKCYIYIDRNVPEAGTCDMAYWHIFIEPESAITDKIDNINWTDIQLIFNEVNLGTGELVTVEYDGKMLSLIIPEGWEYSTSNDLSSELFIEFWPEGETGGKIKFMYDENFGVCGTGLESEEVTLGGHTGSMGTYDNNTVWTFIAFDLDYHIWNYGADKWWNEHGAEAMEILDTIEYR